MFKNFSPCLGAARIASLFLATLLIAAFGAPLEAKGVTNLSKESRLSTDLQFSSEMSPESPSGETFRVHAWIPGFDDVEPVFACTPIFTPSLMGTKSSSHVPFGKLAGVDGCGVIFRMLPWSLKSGPARRVEIFLPII